MRGARAGKSQAIASSRIIPAYAGSTAIATAILGVFRDHPRVCGEHRPPPQSRTTASGSSPRMRGAPPTLGRPTICKRIIPAYAGSTDLQSAPDHLRKDHPRVCGEHSIRALPAFVRRGSSPRMRGAPCRSTLLACSAGIIPAYAGSTSLKALIAPTLRDHPRVCGEHEAGQGRLHPLGGSSPRMRGAQGRPAGSRLDKRIIPAYAGSTCRRSCATAWTRDHPRVCGEHIVYSFQGYAGSGSSPRMRGAQITKPLACIWIGIIPAYAGSTH